MPQQLLKDAKQKAKKRGYNNVQSFITEAVREKLYDEDQLTSKEVALLERIYKITNEKNRWGTEEELWTALKEKAAEPPQVVRKK